MTQFKKILVCAPTAAAKNYCFEEWIKNVMNFTYPNYEIRLFDNTDDGGINANLLNLKFKNLYGQNNMFQAIQSNIKGIKSVIEKMSISHNDCRTYALENNYDYIFHLESDVFPQEDIIENLIFDSKEVVGAVYYRDEGIYRKPTLQRHLFHTANNVTSINFDAHEDMFFMDGSTKKIAAVGLGCVLIKINVFNKIKFRFIEGRDFHPDTYFSEDCHRNKIDIFANTACIARHDNKVWGKFGIDYN